jgi:hypothetical protein
MNPPDPIASPPVARALLEAPTRLILGNYRRLLGRDLVSVTDPAQAVEALFEAPCVVLAAFGEFGTDHRFSYANRAGLQRFETTWDELIGLPSSLSAEPVCREERRRLLDEVGRRGYIDNYAGVRISRRGRRFRILQAVVFNLLDDQGGYVGQAATFADWEELT